MPPMGAITVRHTPTTMQIWTIINGNIYKDI
jgi:hypothetical protein